MSTNQQLMKDAITAGDTLSGRGASGSSLSWEVLSCSCLFFEEENT